MGRNRDAGSDGTRSARRNGGGSRGLERCGDDGGDGFFVVELDRATGAFSQLMINGEGELAGHWVPSVEHQRSHLQGGGGGEKAE
jgi:hypothetical protein